jgi:hypothetical protein
MKNQEKQLWKQAKERVGFRYHLAGYLVVNIILWSIWVISGDSYMWPIWCTLGWGTGLGFHYVEAYITGGNDKIQREYDKLKQQQGQSN